MQPQFSLFADPPPPATWVTPPPVNAAPAPQDVSEAAEITAGEEAQNLEPQVAITTIALEESVENISNAEVSDVDFMTVIAVGSEYEPTKGLTCPNCGSLLEGRKCKLLCPKPGCGYMVTCSEW